MHQRGPVLVRIALLTLVVGAFAMALVQPSQAGSPEAPEVQDPAGDVTSEGGIDGVPEDVPILGPQDFASVDIVSAWVNGNATRVWLVLTMNGDASADATYNATFTIAGTTYGVEKDGADVTGPTGVTAAITGASVNFTMPATSIGAVAGVALTNLTVRTSFADGALLPVGPAIGEQSGTDEAGPGSDFTFLAPQADDVDADQIPDDCETQYFNGTTEQDDASADPDGDGLTIGQECALGTDPTKADSDGDGRDDKSDPFPTDATRGGTGTGTGTRTPTSTRTNTGGVSTRTSSTTGADAGEVRNLGDAIDKLESDLGYIGMSSGGLVVVIVLAIVALAVRWSL